MTRAAVSLGWGHRPSTAALARTAGLVAVAVVGATGVLIALAGAAADHGFLVPGLRRAWAGYVVGPLAPAGIAAPLHVFFTEVAVMSAAYAAVLACATRIRLRWIGATVLVLHVAFLLRHCCSRPTSSTTWTSPGWVGSTTWIRTSIPPR